MKNILNFGSINIDSVYEVPKFVTSGETISSYSLEVFPGGKGLNQSIAISRAGGKVAHAGLIGVDGEFLLRLLSKNKVDIENIHINEKKHTGTAVIQLNSNKQNCIIVHGGTNSLIDRSLVDEVLCKYQKNDWLLLQNEISCMPYIIEMAAAKGMKIALNPSPADSSLFDIDLDKVDLFILNEHEAKFLCDSEYMPKKLIKTINKMFPKSDVVLTLGSHGAMMLSEGSLFYQPAYRVKTVDTTAAGDTFTGYLMSGLVAKKDINETLKNASIAAAIAVSRKGAAPSIPTIDEVLKVNLRGDFLLE